MKLSVRLCLCFAALFILQSGVAAGQTLTTNPANPSSDRNTSFSIRGDWHNGCIPRIGSGDVSGSGFVIRVEAKANPTCSGCITAITPYQLNFASTSPLRAGTYTIEYYVTDCTVRTRVATFSFRVDDATSGCRFDSITPTACPAEGVKTGEPITLLWCDPSPAQEASKVTWTTDAGSPGANATAIAAYRVMIAGSPDGPWSVMKTSSAERTWTQVTPNSSQAGSNYFRVEADMCPSQAPCSPDQMTTVSTNALLSVVSPVTPACSTDTVLCAFNRRFRVSVRYKNQFANPPVEGSLQGRSVDSSDKSETTAFWFNDRNNIEVLVKILDARPIQPKIHIAWGTVTDVEVWIMVLDTVTNVQREYHKGPNQIFGEFDRITFNP